MMREAEIPIGLIRIEPGAPRQDPGNGVTNRFIVFYPAGGKPPAGTRREPTIFCLSRRVERWPGDNPGYQRHGR